MGRVRTLVVDDEPPARRKLTSLLAARPDLELVGEAGDGLEALAMIESLRPDLVLLDVHMPELDGFGVLDALEPSRWPVVVFVTAYDEFAVQAFEVGAADYVLKPVNRDRLDTAVGRAVARVSAGGGAGALQPVLEQLAPKAPLSRFVVRSLDRLWLVRADEVRWIEAAGNYVKLHTAGRTHLVRSTLKRLERRLDPARFARIHRSVIVALPEIEHLRPAGHGDYEAVLRSGQRLAVSRRYRDRLPPALAG